MENEKQGMMGELSKRQRAASGRVLQLDILRGVAVLLVLLAHSTYRGESAGIFRPVVAAVLNFGWTGVDLFFVLSGFLVGGLLFKELRTRSSLHVRRFLVRRGLKIWPAFAVFIVYFIASQLHR